MATHFEYTVRQGDTLHGILQKVYGVAPQSPEHGKSLQYLLALNPQIKDPNRIRAGDVLRLTEHLVSAASQGQQPPSSVVSAPLISQGVPTTGPDGAGFYAVTWLAENSNSFLLPGSTAAGFGAGLLSGGNLAYVHEMDNLYASYKGDTLSKGQYDYRRALALKKFQANVGPMERVLFGGSNSQQKLRIARAGGVPANANLVHHAARLKRLGQLANSGGLVLTGVGLAASCVQIANAADQREKNSIFVESAVSSGVSVMAGTALGLFLVSNPVGWGAALILAAGVTAWSYNSGKLARHVYDTSGTNYDLTSKLGISNICR